MQRVKQRVSVLDILNLHMSSNSYKRQGRRRRSGRTASAGPLFWPTMLSAVSLFLVSAHLTFYSEFIQSAKSY